MLWRGVDEWRARECGRNAHPAISLGLSSRVFGVEYLAAKNLGHIDTTALWPDGVNSGAFFDKFAKKLNKQTGRGCAEKSSLGQNLSISKKFTILI